MLWVTFAPISDETNDYFDGIGATAVNMLAVVFSITYPLGTVIGVITTKNFGLRGSVLCGGLLTVSGALLRLVGAASR